MTLELLTLLGNIQTVLLSIAIVLCFLRFNQRELYIKLFGAVLILSVSANFLADGLLSINITPNYAGSIYYIVSFPVISALYYNAINRQYSKAFIIVVMFYILFSLINLLFFQRSDINSYTGVLMSALIIFYALYYFYWLLKELPTTRLHRLPMFWINAAHIIFYSGNIFLFGLTSYIVNVLKDNLLVYWMLHNALGLLQASMFIIASVMDLRRIK